tara:strand:- start:736 stop:987 length:252 start_codon:yes stop_codon:yes gene_type:complete
MISDLSRQLFSDISNSVSKTLSNKDGLPGQEQLKQALQAALGKLDLVTRDEFDAQTAVLLRTREKLEAMEVQIAELDLELDKK